jgi:hypothetical protein
MTQKKKTKVRQREADHMVRISHRAFVLLKGIASRIMEDVQANPSNWPGYEDRNISLSDTIRIIVARFKETNP